MSYIQLDTDQRAALRDIAQGIKDLGAAAVIFANAHVQEQAKRAREENR